MVDAQATLATLYTGWHNYQELLCAVLQPLSAEQLAVRAAPSLRSLGDVVLHMIGARARWFNHMLGEGDQEFAALAAWDRPGMPSRSAAEMVSALQLSWQVMQSAVARWTPDQWAQQYENDPGDEPAILTRAWVLWHLIEHDLHHGGEVSLMLGMSGLAGPDI